MLSSQLSALRARLSLLGRFDGFIQSAAGETRIDDTGGADRRQDGALRAELVKKSDRESQPGNLGDSWANVLRRGVSPEGAREASRSFRRLCARPPYPHNCRPAARWPAARSPLRTGRSALALRAGGLRLRVRRYPRSCGPACFASRFEIARHDARESATNPAWEPYRGARCDRTATAAQTRLPT